MQRDPTLLVFKDSTYYELPADVPDEEFLKLWIETEQFVAYNQLTGKLIMLCVSYVKTKRNCEFDMSDTHFSMS